jgi:ectoine hydroxylase-related dioxygenase (phytanoyl-CoA dioxygenase family)
MTDAPIPGEAPPANAVRRRLSLTDDGYVVLKDFLTPTDRAAAARAADALMEQPIEPSCVRPHNTLAPLRFNDALVDIVLRRPDRIARLASSIRADDLRWISGYLSSKAPHSDALWWHQDWWCWWHAASFRPQAPQVALLIYLCDTDAGGGALRVWPGSHRWSTRLHPLLPEAHRSQSNGLSPDHPAMRDHPEQITLAVQAGDAVAMDYRLLHGTHPNARPDRRDCVLLNFAPAWISLPEDLRGHLISGYALPGAEEVAGQAWADGLLPHYEGERRDLELRRDAPAVF